MTADLAALVREALLGPCALAPRTHVLAACSGGLDSTVLLRVLAEVAAEYPLQLSAATVDHGLRSGVDAEIDLVRRACEGLGVTWHLRSVVVPEDRIGDVGVEAAAREVRRAALRDARAACGADVVALAHHRRDQAETVLMRALVGTGTRGLAAMSPRHGAWIRPLIDVDVEVLERYARDRGLRWAEDPSNADRRFLRNRLRHELMPSVRAVFGDSADRHLAGLARRAAGDERLLSGLAQERLVAVEGGDGWVPAAALAALDPALAARVLQEMLRRLDPHAGLGQLHTDTALALLVGPDRDAGVDLPGGLRLERAGDAVRATAGEEPLELREIPVPLDGTVAWPAGDLRVRAVVHADPSRVVADAHAGRSRAWFDLDRLTMPLSMRKFAPGARIRPFGSRGSKRITELLGEAGIPRRSRHSWPVVADADQVIWVPGARAADVARVRQGTRRILELTLG